MTPIKMTVNGVEHNHEVEPRTLLVHYIRETLGLTGAHVGCETSICGACTVMIDGRAAKSCTRLAVQADGASVMTIEGLGVGTELHALQESFWNEHGLQCGFCTPGMIMSAHDLLRRDPDPDDAAIRESLDGNLCRCTGYQNIVKAVRTAAQNLRDAEGDA